MRWAASLSLFVAAPALAEVPDPATIVVTAPGGEFDADDAIRLSAADVRRTGAPDLIAALARAAPALSVSEATSNPYAPDIFYRGYRASPLQGAAQGLAAYVDGARFNLPFGDTVDLSLIPEIAIERVTVRDASPVYGLNALGGALVIATRTGRSEPGVRVSLAGGSYGQLESTAEAGGARGDLSVYAAFESDREDGWRRFSPSERYAGLINLGWDGARGGVHLKLAHAEADLTGNGAAPLPLLAADTQAVFTFPDNSRASLFRASLHPYLDLAPTTRVEGTLYWLRYTQRTLNGDAADVEACEDGPPGFVCLDGEDPLFDTSGRLIPDTLGGEGYGALNRSRTQTQGGGLLAQLTDRRDFMAGENALTLGISYDASATRFRSSSELGELEDDRSVEGLGPVISQPDGLIAPVQLRALTRYLGLFAVDRLPLLPGLTAEIGLRYNRARIRLVDGIGTALNGSHRFERINPGAELDWQLSPELSLRAGYAETNRAPTPAELSCADEASPCALANFFLADPPLKQVVARTVELGASGRARVGGWSVDYLLSAYRATNADDIQLIASTVRGRGFFQNVGRTRRQGVEATLAAERGRWRVTAGYAWTDATFRSALTLPSPNNPAADANGRIAVSPGDPLPSIARHRGTLSGDYTGARFSVGGDLQAQSGVGYVGDEVGALPDTGAFAVVNLRASATLGPRVTLFADVRNLLDTRFSTFGILGDGSEVDLPEVGRAVDDPRFASPGQPRRVRVGVRARF